MPQLSIEMLSGEAVYQIWPTLLPLVRAACEGNEIAKDEMDPQYVLEALLKNKAVMFAGYEDKQVACIIIFSLFTVNGRKGADVMALAGKRVLAFKAAYFERILDCLKENKIEFLDAYVPMHRAEMYMRKFGFNKSCAYIRMNLGAEHE